MPGHYAGDAPDSTAPFCARQRRWDRSGGRFEQPRCDRPGQALHQQPLCSPQTSLKSGIAENKKTEPEAVFHLLLSAAVAPADKRDLPEVYNEVYIETGIDGEAVPIGYFTIQKPIEDNEFKVKIKATDYMKKFEDNKYDGSDLTYPATMLQVLQDICTKVGVE